MREQTDPSRFKQEETAMAAALDTPYKPVTGADESGRGVGAPQEQEAESAEVEAALRGEEEAYARLMRRYEPEISRQMWRFTRNLSERDELVQEVFVEAYLGLRGYRRKAPFLHWLRTIAIRRGFRFWKQRERLKRLVPLEEWDGARRKDPPGEPNLAAETLFGLLQRLKPEDRVVMTLEYLEERSVEEIALLLGWTKAMVKMRAYRAKKKLRGMYERLRGRETES